MEPIPLEIIDHIFSFLKSDPTTLTTCSRTHPILAPLAEPFLYAHVVVVDNHGLVLVNNDDCPNFFASELHKLLIDSPHIVTYVRKLSIILSLASDGWHADGIAPILPILSHLNSISLTSPDFGGWNSLPAEFRNAFTNRLSSSLSVWKEISITSWINVPLHIIDNCKTVKSISLYRYVDTGIDFQVVPLPVLDSLYLSNWLSSDSKFLDWARKRIHNLRSLVFHTPHSSTFDTVLPELVQMCSNSLTSLDFHMCRRFRTLINVDGTINSIGDPIPLDLSSVPHLQVLTICADLYVKTPTEATLSPFPAITRFLQNTPPLNTLIFKFFVANSSDFNSIDWSHFFTFLSHSSHKFNHIGLDLTRARRHLTGSRTPSVQSLRLYHSEVVSDMIAKGILDISIMEKGHSWDMFYP